MNSLSLASECMLGPRSRRDWICEWCQRVATAQHNKRPCSFLRTCRSPSQLAILGRCTAHVCASSSSSVAQHDIDTGLDTTRPLKQENQRDVAYTEGRTFLQTIGIDNLADAIRVLDIAMNPNSLLADNLSKLRSGGDSARLLSVEKDIKPVIECFTSLGLSQEQIKQVVLSHPPVIGYSPSERILPFVDSLRDLGVSDPIELVLRRPSLLGLSNRDNVMRIVSYLQETGCSMEEVVDLLATSI